MEKARAEESTKGSVDDFANNVEEINAAIDAGNLNGINGKAGYFTGRGESGKQYRRINAGLEALRSAMQQNGKSPAEIADTIERLTPSYMDTAATLHDKVNGIATELNNYGAQLSNPSKKVPTSEKGKAPKPGDVVDGYRFKGGNPNDQKNWEPVGQ